MESRESDKTSLPRDVLLNVIRELAEGGTKSITFTGGGEPLMNKATIEAIECAAALGLKTGLVTNGSLLNGKSNETVLRHCSFVRISLDAGSQRSYELLHKPKNKDFDTFDNTINNIAGLVAGRRKTGKDITLGAGFLVHPQNYREIFQLAKLLKETGIDYFQVRPIFSEENVNITKIWVDADEVINKTLELSDDKFYVFPIQRRFDDITSKKKNYDSCLIHTLLSVIGADGNVYLCSLYRGDERFSFGNVKESSFREIWNSEERKRISEMVDINKCPACRYSVYNEVLNYLADRDRPHADFL